jgi:Asp-tRNA(Asn)/Glu-tRNA(Gln) amidotransferase B subunit
MVTSEQNQQPEPDKCDLRITKSMLLEELLEILYDNDEIWIPHEKIDQLELHDLVKIIEANKINPEPPKTPVPEEATNLQGLMQSIESGQFLDILSDQIERIFQNDPD